MTIFASDLFLILFSWYIIINLFILYLKVSFGFRPGFVNFNGGYLKKHSLDIYRIVLFGMYSARQ